MKLSKVLTTAIAMATGSASGATVYFSTTGFGGGASLGNPDHTVAIGDANFDLHLYFVPEPGDAAFLGISVNLTSTVGGVADFVGLSVTNPDILVGAADVDDRWDGTGGTIPTPELISNMSGVAVTTAGLTIGNNGTGPFLDAGYDATAGAFYFGSITLDPVGLGTTEISISNGPIGTARAGDVPRPTGPVASIFYGDDPTSVFGDDFGGTGTVTDATINVIPEPSTSILFGTGILFGFLRRRR